MKTKNLLLTALFLLALGFSSYGQWITYTCDVTPNMADPVWLKASSSDATETQPSTRGEDPVLTTVVADPDIPGNNLLSIDRYVDGQRESWKTPPMQGGFADENIGATAVWRVKPTAELITMMATPEEGKEYMYCYFSMRSNAFMEELYFTYPGTVKLNRADITYDVPGYDWHIFRMTLKNDNVNVYLDENPVAILSGVTTKTSDDSIARFGINNGTPEFQGHLYDWIAFDESGAYAPGEGTPLPSTLTGLPGGGNTSVKDTKTSRNLFSYPNPISSETTISFELKENAYTTLSIYNTVGQVVKTLINQEMMAGTHVKNLSLEGLSEGLYLLKLKSGSQTEVEKIIIKK